jgi:hypothetical protein
MPLTTSGKLDAPPALVQVEAIDAGGLDAHQHLALARLGLRHLLDPEHLRPAGLVDHDRAHGSKPRVLPVCRST